MDQANLGSVFALAGALGGDPVKYRAGVSPDAIAVRELSTGIRLSYAELDRRIAGCAGSLKKMQGIAGERIAVLGRNSLDQIVLAMACERAGAIFVPLNWRLAETELRALVEDCGPTLLAHDAAFAETAGAVAAAGTMLRAFDALAGVAGTTDRPLPDDRTADTPVALLYTSGTTGRPKGVIVTRANALFAAVNFALVGEIGPRSVVLSDLPLFHTIGLIAVTRTTLMMGGTLIVSDRFIAGRTLAALADGALGVTHYFGVPQIAAAMRDEPGFPDAMLARLNAIFLGGAPLPAPLVEAYLAKGVALVNGYGMSEAGTVAHMPIDKAAIRRNPDAIGLTAPLVDVRIVDQHGTDIADDAVGELWIRGPSVTPGYWQKPLETAAAFADGWLRTGDLVSRSPDGMLRLVDRLKDMYISGGENVYPAEVEAVLLAHPDVSDAAVVGFSDPRWGEVGVAFIVGKAGGAPDEATIRAHCASRLARYKCPMRLMFVTSIPRTASGKVQKHRLRAIL